MNKIFIIILTLVLSLPISVWAVDDAQPTEPVSVVETVEQDSQIGLDVQSNQEVRLGENMPELPNISLPENSASFKQPISKRKLVKKFVIGMFAVIVSSLILFFGLTIYNRIRETVLNRVKTPEGEVSLQTPDDLKIAVKTFLDKTSWK